MPSFAKHRGGTLTDEQIKILAGGLKPKWQSQLINATGLPPYAVTTGNASNGKQVFAAACAGCHRAQGEGGDAGAINDVAFLSLISDQALRRFIITGAPTSACRTMPIAHDETRPFSRSPQPRSMILCRCWLRGEREGLAMV